MTAQQAFRNTLVVVATLALVYVLWMSSEILVVLLTAIIVASAVRPAVVFLVNHGFPQLLAIVMIYFVVGLAITLLVIVVLPPAASQLGSYFASQQNPSNGPSTVAQHLADLETGAHDFISNLTQGGVNIAVAKPQDIDASITELTKQVAVYIPNIAADVGRVLGWLILVVVMGVYWLIARDQAMNFTMQLFSIAHRPTIHEMFYEIETSMGAYLRGILAVCSFVGIANFILLTILGVPNAITLAFIVGATTAIPILGGYIGATTAVVLALIASPTDGAKYALFAFASFVLVQQVETHYLTPRVMSRSVGLNPILVIVFLAIGFSVGGVIGALLAVPIAGTIVIVLRHLVIEPRKEENAPHIIDGGVLVAPKEDIKLTEKLPQNPRPTVSGPTGTSNAGGR